MSVRTCVHIESTHSSPSMIPMWWSGESGQPSAWLCPAVGCWVGDETGGDGFLFYLGNALHPVQRCEKLTNTTARGDGEKEEGWSKNPNTWRRFIELAQKISIHHEEQTLEIQSSHFDLCVWFHSENHENKAIETNPLFGMKIRENISCVYSCGDMNTLCSSQSISEYLKMHCYSGTQHI